MTEAQFWRERADELAEALERLRQSVEHNDDCALYSESDCDCGYARARRDADEALAAYEAGRAA